MPAKKKATKRPSVKKAPPKKAKRVAKKRSAAPKSAAPSLSDALAEAAWEEADLALAEALVEADALMEAVDDSSRATAIAFMVQALSRAARKRGLSRIGELGGPEKYDPARHELAGSVAKKPRNVRIAARGVVRGVEVLQRPRALPVVRKTRKSGR